MRNKKLLIILASMMLLSSLWSTLALAANDINTGALINVPTSADEELKWKQATVEKDRLAQDWFKQHKGKVSAKNTWVINVSNFRQEKTNWCGPASAKQSLSFHKVKSGSSVALPSQSTLAAQIGTTASGSSTAAIANVLNSYASVYGGPYIYLASDISNEANPTATFQQRVYYDITYYMYAPIVLMRTSYLPRYNGASYGHYNTLDGYSDTYSPIKIQTVDPHYSSSYYGYWWDPMGSTTVNGVCRAVYQADLEGTNKAMAW